MPECSVEERAVLDALETDRMTVNEARKNLARASRDERKFEAAVRSWIVAAEACRQRDDALGDYLGGMTSNHPAYYDLTEKIEMEAIVRIERKRKAEAGE